MVKSISREYTFNADSNDKEEWKRMLLVLSQDVARRARWHGIKGSTVVLAYRRPDFSRHSRRMSLPYPADVARIIYSTACMMLDELKERSLRLIGVGITGLNEDNQTDLFGSSAAVRALEESERAVDIVMERFGGAAIGKGTEMDHRRRSGRNRIENSDKMDNRGAEK